MSFLIQITKPHEHIYFFSKKSSPTPVPYLNPAPGLENINIAQVAKQKRTHYEQRKTGYKSIHDPYPN